ncbi:MAG: hypothetical protein ACYDAD_15505 [Acidimicrobiales bacterium]
MTDRSHPPNNRRGHRRWPVPAFFALVVLVVYQPLAMLDRLPRNVGDPAFVTWTLAWGARALTTHPSRWFDAPIFWPHHSTLAYSDPLIPLAPVYGVLHTVTGSWTVAVGLLAVALVALNLAATYALARRLTGRREAAVLAALVFGISDFALSQWGHIQLQAMGLIPLAFLLLLRLLDRGRLSDALGLGLLQGLMALTTASVALAWAVAAPVVVVVHVVSRLLHRSPAPWRVWRGLLIVAAVSFAVVAPTTRPYVELQRDAAFRRPVSPAFHLRALDLLTPSRHRQVLSGPTLPVTGRHTPEREYFPSLTALLLAGVGIVGIRRRRSRSGPRHADPHIRQDEGPESARRRHELALVAAAALVGLLVGLGPDIGGIPGPYRFLHEHVPGFAGLRVASRFAMVTVLGVAVLAGAGLARILRALRSSTARRVVTAAVLGAALFELAIPVKWKVLPNDGGTLAVYRALAARPAGAVVELPIADPRDGERWSTTEGPRMVYSTIDWHPRVNGYSGFVPPGYWADATVLGTFPAPCAVALARRLGVRWVVLHEGVRNGEPMLSGEEVARIVSSLPDASAIRYGDSWLVDLDLVGTAPCNTGA